MSQTTTPAALPNVNRIWCRRCAAAWVLVTVTDVLKRVAYLDPEPTAAGLYALGPDGSAVRLGPDEIAPGRAMYSEHRCARPATRADG
jgi:hypothetical protein